MPTPLRTHVSSSSYADAAKRGVHAKLYAQQQLRAANASRVFAKLRTAAKRKASPAPVQSSGTDATHASVEATEETSAKRAKEEPGAGDVARHSEPAGSAEPNCMPQQATATTAASAHSHKQDTTLMEARSREIHHVVAPLLVCCEKQQLPLAPVRQTYGMNAHFHTFQAIRVVFSSSSILSQFSRLVSIRTLRCGELTSNSRAEMDQLFYVYRARIATGAKIRRVQSMILRMAAIPSHA